jgi:hypothetical protein
MLEADGSALLATKFCEVLDSALDASYNSTLDFTYRLNSVVFSYTILMWSETSTKPREFKVHGMAFLLLLSGFFRTALRCRFPLRIGVAFGPVVIEPDNHIFIGTPIVNAHLTEQAQDWVGIACHNSCRHAPGNREQSVALDGKYHGPMVGYKIPFKDGKNVPAHHTLDWPAWESEFLEPSIEAALRSAVAKYAGTPFEKRWSRALDYFLHRRRTYPYGQILSHQMLENMFAEARRKRKRRSTFTK